MAVMRNPQLSHSTRTLELRFANLALHRAASIQNTSKICATTALSGEYS
jgi:hypothetical protein